MLSQDTRELKLRQADFYKYRKNDPMTNLAGRKEPKTIGNVSKRKICNLVTNDSRRKKETSKFLQWFQNFFVF